MVSDQKRGVDVERDGDLLAMNFPARPPGPREVHGDLVAARKENRRRFWARGIIWSCMNRSGRCGRLTPDMQRLAGVDRFAVIMTAPGEYCDFVSRFFRALEGRAGRSGDWLGALHADSVLVEAARENEAAREAGFGARRGIVVRGSGRARADGGESGAVSARDNFGLSLLERDGPEFARTRADHARHGGSVGQGNWKDDALV